MDYYKIGQQIRKFRKVHGFSQEELAERVNISTTHMSHIETGSTKLSLPVLVDIASVLQVRTDDILGNNLSVQSSEFNEIIAALEGCNPQQYKVISDVVKATRQAMEKYL